MGNIRTSFVKRLAKELIETHKGVFTTDFEENKKLVQEIFFYHFFYYTFNFVLNF